MKRVLISFIVSVLFVIIVTSISVMLFDYNIISLEISHILGFPVRFPAVIYLYILGFSIPENEIFEALLIIAFILFDILFYTLIFYGLSSLITIAKKNKKLETTDMPPDPPIFE